MCWETLIIIIWSLFSPRYEKYITFPTRGNNTLVQCYSNISKKIYTLQSLGLTSQHSHSKRLKAELVTVRTVLDCRTALIQLTWTSLGRPQIILLAVTSAGVHLCVCPSGLSGFFPDQKPWFNQDVQVNIKECNRALQSGNNQKYQLTSYALLKSIMAAKRTHAEKQECRYNNHNRHPGNLQEKQAHN